MVGNIVSKSRSILKDGYQSAHESLCAKLQQARTIANVAAKGDLGDAEFLHLVWCVADLLDEACNQCECLTAQDFKPAE